MVGFWGFKIAISVGDIIFGFGLILIAIALSRKDKKPVIVYAQDFEIEEIVDDNFAEREELIPQIESHQPVLFRIESELMPATNMDNDIEFIEQVQVLQSQLSKVGNAKEANDPDYIIVSPPEVNISIPNLEQADEIIDLNIDKELVDVQNKRKYRGIGKIFESRDVISMKMGKDDGANLCGVVAEGCELIASGFFFLQKHRRQPGV